MPNINGINPTKITGIAKEIGSKKEVVKETVQKAVKEIKTQTSNVGRDLVNYGEKHSPNLSVAELSKEGYTIGTQGIVYKMDHKKELYQAFTFDHGKISNVTIQDTTYGHKHSIVTQKLEEGKWVSVSQGKTTFIHGDPSERAIKKATELQFDGYKVTAQDEKTLTLCKDDASVVISKENGKEIK